MTDRSGSGGDLFLGLDLGTSGCKLIAFDATGRQLARAARTYPLSNPQAGFFELDPETVWARAVECFTEIDAERLPGRAVALAISAQGEAVMPIDRAGRAIAASPVSADMRGASHAERLGAALGEKAIYTITGQPLTPLPSLVKIMWWRENAPELLSRTWKFVCYGEFALARLGLPPVIDEGMAARTMGFDIRKRAWSPTILEAAAIDPGVLAEVRPSGSIMGSIADDVARALRLPPGVIVALGGHDQPMGALGAGIISPGNVLYAIGTTEALVAVLDRPNPALRRHNIPCYPHVVAGRYVALAGSQSGARALRWWHEKLARVAGGAEQPSLDEQLRALPDTPPGGPLVLSHFAGSGTALNDPWSLGAIYGLSFEIDNQDVLRGLLEGITFEQAINLGAMREASVPIDRIRVVGGGTRSPNWLQMKADILGRTLDRVAADDGPCLGAAILGAVAVGRFPDVEAAAESMVALAGSVPSRADRHELYAARLEIYRDLYTVLKPVGVRLRRLAAARTGAGDLN